MSAYAQRAPQKDPGAEIAPVGETADLILDAVERLIGRYGYQKMTLDDIAREAGVGRRTIYLHFPSKEEVALCSIDRVVARVRGRLEEIARTHGLTTPERLRRMLVARVLVRIAAVRDYHEGLDSLFEALRPAYLRRRARYFEAEAEAFARVLEGGREDGSLSFGAAGDALPTAKTLLLATNSLLPYSLSVRELGEPEEIAARAERLAALLLDGLRSR
jgi:AcrR family transcriptional regulator